VGNFDIKSMYIEKVIITKESSDSVSNRISNKQFSLQFLPECLYGISTVKTLEFNGTKLKTNYLIDIVHNLILKYYFKKENRFALNATILKDKYGYLYNYYINYLVTNGVLVLKTNYRNGYTSRVYALDENIFIDKIKRYKNLDKVLLKKYKNKFVDMIHINDTSKVSLIEPLIKEKLVSDLFSVKIEYDRAIFFLDALKHQDIDIYNRNIYSVDCINDKHIFYHFDDYGRMHTNYTILKSFIRKNCLLIDGEETCELDIPNSQPLFLTKIIDMNSNLVDKEELQLFKELTISGTYYQYVMKQLGETDKKKIKEMTYKVLFGRNIASSKVDKNFKNLFPTIHQFIKNYKKEHGDYRILAYDLQKAESDLIFNTVIKKVIQFYPEIKLITIHDSIVIPKKYKKEVNQIFEIELKKEFSIK
jgi:hypothetical protein